MSTDSPALLEIANDEAQVLRLFAIGGDTPAEARLVAAAAEGAQSLSDVAGELLGGVLLDPAWIELVDQNDVESMGGLEAYLRAGYDPPDGALALLRPAMETAPRRLLLLLSRAFGGQAATLQPGPDLTCLAAASLIHAPPIAAPLGPDTQTARHDPPAPAAKPPMSDARISGMVAMVALLIAGALVLMMVLVAG